MTMTVLSEALHHRSSLGEPSSAACDTQVGERWRVPVAHLAW